MSLSLHYLPVKAHMLVSVSVCVCVWFANMNETIKLSVSMDL